MPTFAANCMTNPSSLRLFVDPPRPGTDNMAIDQALLQAGIAGQASLRFYQWVRPTISLGHFQAAGGLSVPERFAGLEVVRRLSGGGAILHHLELTYSCVLPAEHALAREPSRMYDAVHQALIDVLGTFGIQARFRGADAFVDQSFLCFSRGDGRDLLIDRHKIVGSAQRRRQGAVLQHGSILLNRSPLAPEFPGITELSGVTLQPEALIVPLAAAIADRLALSPTAACLFNFENAPRIGSAAE